MKETESLRRLRDRKAEEGVEYMCRAFEETRNEKAIWIAKNMIELGKNTLEDIARVTGLSLEKVQELAGAKTA